MMSMYYNVPFTYFYFAIGIEDALILTQEYSKLKDN